MTRRFSTPVEQLQNLSYHYLHEHILEESKICVCTMQLKLYNNLFLKAYLQVAVTRWVEGIMHKLHFILYGKLNFLLFVGFVCLLVFILGLGWFFCCLGFFGKLKA